MPCKFLHHLNILADISVVKPGSTHVGPVCCTRILCSTSTVGSQTVFVPSMPPHCALEMVTCNRLPGPAPYNYELPSCNCA